MHSSLSIFRQKSILAIMLLILLGYLGNYFNLSLFFGVDFLFGSISVLLILAIFGMGWGTIAGVLVSCSTYFLWNHPYGIIILVCEVLFVGFLLTQNQQNIVGLDSLYWLLIGIPLTWLFYKVVMRIDAAQTLMIMLKYSVNGIFNALIVSLLITYLPNIQKILGHSPIKKTLSLRQILFNLLVAFVVFPSLTIMVLDAQRVINDTENTIKIQLSSTAKSIAADLNFWYQRRADALIEVAKIAADDKKQPEVVKTKLANSIEILQKTFSDLQNIYVAKANGEIITSYPNFNENKGAAIWGNFTKNPKNISHPLVTNAYLDAQKVPLIGLSMPIIINNQFQGFIYSALNLKEISDRLQAQIADPNLQILLVDNRNKIISSSKSDQLIMQDFDLSHEGQIRKIGGDVYQWLPKQEKMPPMVQWKKSIYVQQSTINNNLPWKVVLQAQAAPHINYLQSIYIKDLAIILILSALAFGAAMLMSSNLVKPLLKLAEVTNNLPEKILEQQRIDWSNSKISELDSLAHNFKIMAIALNQKFQEIQDANETLEQKVAERTAKVVKANKKLKREILERKRAEKALRENEQQLAQIFETIPNGVIILNCQGQLISANPAAEKILGLKRSQLTQRIYNAPEWQITTIDGKPFPEEELPFVRVMQTGKPVYGVEHAIKDANGMSTILAINAAPLCNAAGEIVSVVAALSDISERKWTEQALRESEERYRTVIETAAEGIILHYADGTIRTCNNSAARILGLSPTQMMGRTAIEPCWSIIYEDGSPFPKEQHPVTITLTTGEPQSDVVMGIYKPDGDLNWISINTRPLVFAGENKPYAVVSSFFDITERKQAEAEILTLNAQLEQRVTERTAQLEAANQLKDELLIREQAARSQVEASEQRFRILAELIPVQVWTSKPNGELNYINPRVVEFFGVSQEQILGCNWQQVIHPEDLPQCLEHWQQSLEAGSPYEVEFRLRGADGNYYWHLARALPLQNQEGEIINWFGTNTDIDGQKQSEAMLKQQTQALTQANRIKDEFLAIVSHELRTPLNSIMGWAKLLRSRKFDENTTAKALETIERNAKSQSQIIDDILEISRIVRGKIRLNICSVKLLSTVERAIDAIRPTAEVKNIQIISTLDSSIGTISVDPERMQQVIWNLLSNAIKFTPNGKSVEVKLERVIDQQQNHDWAQIQVIDTGKGISPEFLPHVFERFRQADSSITRSHGGLGLGLAIVRNLVEMHGGTVNAYSAGEGQGATFTILLPLPTQSALNSPSTDSPKLIEQENLSLNSSLLQGLQILLVEDEADTREFFITVLEQAGAEISAAASVIEALQILQNSQPHLLISDIGMPLEDGYALIRKVRAMDASTNSQIPAIALTAYAREEDRQQALLAGFQIHLSKPIDPNRLVEVVAHLAKRRQKL